MEYKIIELIIEITIAIIVMLLLFNSKNNLLYVIIIQLFALLIGFKYYKVHKYKEFDRII